MIAILGKILFFIGFLFALLGIIGVLRFPDFYSRLHAVGKSDTLGIALMLIGIALQNRLSLDTLKILFILVFIFFANPLLTHALSRAALKFGLKPWELTDEEKLR
ncbi:MAG TPA: monovalent cation/H(+) antiporter subunit G [Oligoflexia bacterium]|nr:monovalent cation/H(+) antiporter subunit G [Oligoflexia bacterium]HMR24726.1 monovalent cation/H(+) antiporter subunit G [Oligoflexia bacterium]